MKNVIKKNSKLIIAFSLGFILSIGTVFAASKLYASKVSVDTTNMPALGSESNVEEALTYLYQRAADAGLTGTGNHSLVPTRYDNVYETYLDPTNLSRKCTAAEVVSTAGTNSGCMKWYVYNESSTNYSMILDHNVGEAGGYTVQATLLKNATSSWDNRLNIRQLTIGETHRVSGYSNGSNNGAVDLGYYIYTIPGGGSGSKLIGNHPMAWLFDNLSGCLEFGCRTEDANGGDSYFISYSNYAITKNGDVTTSSSSKVRPVIDISKAIF